MKWTVCRRRSGSLPKGAPCNADGMQLDDLIVYHRGDFRRYADAKVGLLTHALNYGTACFERHTGLWNADVNELSLLEPTAHFRRLAASAKVLLMDLPFAPEKLVETTVELARAIHARAEPRASVARGVRQLAGTRVTTLCACPREYRPLTPIVRNSTTVASATVLL
jgi:branched-subunit amino acid aminotransferase/4-amino-4-deoxychorismate lyase